MKLIYLFVVAGILQVHGATAYAQSEQVTLDFDNVEIQEVFNEIYNQTKLIAIYTNGDLSGKEMIDISVRKERVDVVLSQILAPLNMNYRIQNGYIMLTKKANKSFTIKGVIKDEYGETLPGATVYISSLGPGEAYSDKDFLVRGTTADIDGNFELEVELGQWLMVSYTGFKLFNEEIVSEKDYYEIVLEAATSQLDEVVVVGYGVNRRAEISSSIETLSNENLDKNTLGNTSFDRGLGGLIKGVQVTPTSGRPGSGVDINIRGVTSPFSDGDNNPLFVIDGVPFQVNPAFTYRDETSLATVENPLLSINPNDIESIDVLKDASATAIYGSRGANGVVIVTTKKGRKGEKMNIALSSTTTLAKPVNTLEYLSTQEWKAYADEVFTNSAEFANANPLGLDVFSLNQYDYMGALPIDFSTYTISYDGLREEWFGNSNTNWADEVYRNRAVTQQNTVRVSGGSARTDYYFAGGYTNQQGLLLGEQYEQYNLRLGTNTNIREYLSVGVNANVGTSNNKTGYGESNNDLNGLLNARPDLPAYDTDGNFNRLPGDYFGFTTFNSSPLAKTTGYDIENKGLTILGNAYIELEPIRNLKFKSDVNVSRFGTDSRTFAPHSIVRDVIPLLGENQSTLTLSDVVNTNFIHNLTGNYTKLLGDKHTIGATLGFAWDRTTTDRQYYLFSGFPDDKVLTTATSAQELLSQSEARIETGLNSFFSRLSYNYGNKYFLTLNFRTDESIKFAPANRRAYFPSAAASWDVAKENFLKGNKLINHLRLRVGVGRTGSNNIGDFEYLQFFAAGFRNDAFYNGNQAIGLTGTLPNSEIKWETTDEINAGLDFELFDSRLRASVDVYNRQTTGALIGGVYPLETGATTFTANFADLTNKGFEIELGGDIIRNKDLNWSASLNLSRNINTLDKFAENGISPFIRRFYELGREVNIIRGYVVEGIFQNQEDVEALNATAPDGFYQESGTAAGDYKYADLNGDGEITSEDQQYLGSAQPNFFGGFNTQARYKGFELSAFFNFSQGGESTIFSDVANLNPQPNLNTLTRFTDRWTATNTDAELPRAIISDPNNNTRNSDRLVYNTSFLRLKSLQLRYFLPAAAMQSIGFGEVSVFVAGSNLWTLTDFPGLDPELLGGGLASAASSASRDPYPIAKTWSFGANINF